jgi:hypothetical protein
VNIGHEFKVSNACKENGNQSRKLPEHPNTKEEIISYIGIATKLNVDFGELRPRDEFTGRAVDGLPG